MAEVILVTRFLHLGGDKGRELAWKASLRGTPGRD